MSNVIKSTFSGIADGKQISIKTYRRPDPSHNTEQENQDKELVSSIINSAKEEAGMILAQAEEEAKKVRAWLAEERQQLEHDREKVLKDAYEEGFQQGFHEGMRKGYEEAEREILNAQSVVEKAKEEYEKYVEKGEQTILAIAMKAAEKILHQKLEEQPDILLPIIRQAVFEVKEYQNIHIYVHPSRYPLLIDQKDELLFPLSLEKQIYIYPSPELSESDCIIETDGGRIDAGIDTQFAELKKKLYEIFRGDADESH